MGSIGMPEMIFIFVLALLIFGPKKLPELGRSLGKGLSEFRRASTELRSSLEREMHTIEQETKVEEPTETPAEVSAETHAEVSTETHAGVSAGSTTTDEGSSNPGASSGERQDDAGIRA